MIALFTDFGVGSPYAGQMHAALESHAPGVARIDLCHDLPPFEPKSAAYLLDAVAKSFPANTVFLAVVDPGVGGERLPIIVRAGRHWFVGPENGLFEIVARRADTQTAWTIDWRPSGEMSATFHGRDLFAPIAARLALGLQPGDVPNQFTALKQENHRRQNWPDDLSQIIYIDRYGNAMTGFRAAPVPDTAMLAVNGQVLRGARIFSDLNPGDLFWYENSQGLVEIAANRARASDKLMLSPGDRIEIRL